MSETKYTIGQSETESVNVKSDRDGVFLGALQGFGLAVIMLTIGEAAAWYLNWFAVWLMYFLTTLVFPFHWMYDLRNIVWICVFGFVGFISMPTASIRWLGNFPHTKKAIARRWTYSIVLICGLLFWAVLFLHAITLFPW